MSDMLSIGTSALQAFQQALNVTSNNIANSSTTGYNRETVDLSAIVPQNDGTLYSGAGVKVGNINRNANSLLTSQMWAAQSSYSRLDTYSSNADALSNMFADSTTGLSATLQTFSNAVQAVANAPTSTVARQALLGQATQLQSTLQTYNERLDQVDSQINSQLSVEGASITSIAKNIAELNGQIAVASSNGSQASSALLDARDQQIAELSKHVSVSVVAQDDGEENVFIGNGQSLVLGSVAGSIVTQADSYNPSRLTLVFQPSNGGTTVASSLSGGTVGGLLDFRSQLLDTTRNQLGQIAVGVASAVNAQQNSGLDLNGSLGGDLFQVGGVAVQGNARNTGSATVTATRTDTGSLTADDYILSYAGGSWSMRSASTGAAVALSGAGTAASPLTGAGLSIVVASTPANGDSFKIQPTAAAIAGLNVLLSSPTQIAAAAALKTTAASANTGTGTISSATVSDSTNAALLSTATIAFTDATHYSINGAGSYSYTSGGSIAANGWQVAISGTPAAGDAFTVAANSGATGDNTNALAMASALKKGLLDAGKTSVADTATAFVGKLGVATNQAQTSLAAQQTVLTGSQSAISAASGVNLDEEAANLVRYQQAYQAAAQVIKASQTMFDSLLQAFQ